MDVYGENYMADFDPIDTNSAEAIDYWCAKLTCSKEELLDAVSVCGNSGKEVEAYLR